MASPFKPPFNPTKKPLVVALRPAFPVRLDRGVGMPSATKLIAGSARPVWATGLKGSENVVQSSVLNVLGSNYQAVRARMLRHLAAQGVSDAKVLAAMGAVERHRFVDSALANQAYEDTSLPIGLGQTISKPNVVARMLELLREGAGASGKLGRVLEIGTGCGYQAALLSHLASEVYSMERLRGLHEKARENLRTLRLANVHLLFGDGMIGYAKGAPYAAIIAAAGGQAIPPAWIEQLAMGGRLVAPLQTAEGVQALVVVDKTPQGVRQTLLEPVHFVPLKSGTS
jgi:protein-L-isoaspartate(D-aspartate) O-methyltransferase